MSQLWNDCGSFTVDQIRTRLAAIQPSSLTPSALSLRPAAVLVPLICESGEVSIIYTRRTDLVRDHKGQVAFPGGSMESQDASYEETAMRETFEEIGVHPSEICILGQLPVFPTITGFLVYPVVGLIPWPYNFQLSQEEVSRVFTVPLKWLADSSNHQEKGITLSDGRFENVIYFNTYDGENVWGATARITMQFLKLIDLA